jgi:nucleoside-diphosphate-sugar epimerase
MGQKHVIPEFIRRIRKRESPFKLYGGDETRTFCYVEDAVKATFLVATTPACANEIVHIGKSDEEIQIVALAKRIMDQMKFQAEIVECGRRPASVSRRCPETSKLLKLTGFRAAVSLHDGLTRTIDWYSRHDA